MSTPGAAVLACEITLVAGPQARLHHIDVRARTSQHETVAQCRTQREEDPPDRPESAACACRDPYADTDQRQGQRAARLVNQAPTKLRLALNQGKLGRDAADRQVGAQRVQVCTSTRAVDSLQTLLILIGGEAPGDGVLVQLLDKMLALRVGDAYLTGIGHNQNVVHVCARGSKFVPHEKNSVSHEADSVSHEADSISHEADSGSYATELASAQGATHGQGRLRCRAD